MNSGLGIEDSNYSIIESEREKRHLKEFEFQARRMKMKNVYFQTHRSFYIIFS